MDREHEVSFGVFKPVDHVVVSFASAQQADDAVRALADMGLSGDEVRRYSDREMIEQIDRDLARASPIATIGQEVNLVRAHRALAEQGYHWLIVHADDARRAGQVAEAVRRCGAERAQHYGHFIIEELLERPGRLPQVGESPDRGLDAQTPSGREGDASAATDKREPASGATDKR